MLIIHDYLLEYGGAEKVLEEIHQKYPQSDIFTYLLDLDILENSNYLKKLYLQGKIQISIFQSLPFKKKFRKLYQKFSFVYFYCKKFQNASKLYVNTSSGAGLMNRQDNLDKFVYFHKVPSFSFYKKYNFLTKYLHDTIAENLAKYTSIITNSNYNSSIIADRYNVPNKKILIQNPKINIPIITADDEIHFDNMSKLYNIQKNNYFLYVGRLENYKGVKYLVDIFNQNPDLKLILIGKGELMNYHSSKNIKYLGFTNDIVKFCFMKYAKYMITLGGEREEYGMTAAECLGIGGKVIALDIGGNKEVLKRYPNNNILIKDISDIVNIINDK